MEPIIAVFKHVLTYFKLAGEKPGDPCLAKIYYCLRSAGDKRKYPVVQSLSAAYVPIKSFNEFLEKFEFKDFF